MILNNANRFRNRSTSPAEKLLKLRKLQASVHNFDVSKKRVLSAEEIADNKMMFQIEKLIKG
jgi:hypothetical protein